MRPSRRFVLQSLGAAAMAWPALSRAQAGMNPREIVIGRCMPWGSAVFTPVAVQRKIGADACIAGVNAAGGVHGRKLRVVDRDDGYQAGLAAAAVAELIDKEQVFAMLGAFGSPTLPTIMASVEAAGVPLVGAVSLSLESRQPVKRHVFPVRISAFDEARHVVRHQRTLSVERFAILSSREAYGPEGAAAYLAALEHAGIKPVENIAFAAADDPEPLARRLADAKPQVLLISVLAKPFGPVFTHYRKLGGASRAFGFSAMRIEDLVGTLGAQASGVGLSQSFPIPTRRSVPVVQKYHTALSAYDPKATPTQVGLEAFVEASVLVEGLQRAGRGVTREKLVASLESLNNLDLGGLLVRYEPNDRTGSTYVDIVMLGNEKVIY